jgi:hypothetical protein
MMPQPEHLSRMRLVFTKGAGKYDQMRVERPDRASETIACPKQGIIPHDMVHFAVESVLAHRGFLTMVAEGASASFATVGGEPEEAVERLVETFQAEMWGGRVSSDDLLDTYRHACAARAHPAVAVSPNDVEAIRVRMDGLSTAWAGVAVNGSLTLDF